jgi:glycyl-tRNA synthetase beta chain
MGRAYALAQGTDSAVAEVIREHYLPRGADDVVAESDAGALVAIADRLDTLTGSCAIDVMPTGTADPLALRRAAIGFLKTLLAKGWDMSLSEAVRRAHGGFDGVALNHDADATARKLGGFLRQRLRGLLTQDLTQDVVDACLAVGYDRPVDVLVRARSLEVIDPAARVSAGEVFKRAANIAKDAPEGAPESPDSVGAEVHDSERAVFDQLGRLGETIAAAEGQGNYKDALDAIAAFSPTLGRFFDDVFVMVDDARVRDNRLRLMRRVHETCSTIADFNLLARS